MLQDANACSRLCVYIKIIFEVVNLPRYLPKCLVTIRLLQDGLLTVDGGERVTGQSRGSLKTLNIGQLTWIGVIDTDLKESALKRVGTSNGFNGCIKDLKFGRNIVSVQVHLSYHVLIRVCFIYEALYATSFLTV